MLNDKLISQNQNIVAWNSLYNIIQWGGKNDYPQQILRLVQNSVTGQECVKLYASFIAGDGFVEEELNSLVVNQKGETLLDILQLVANDYATFGGFALQVCYNAFLETREIRYIPFEQLRLAPKQKGERTQEVALHWDWGREYSGLKAFSSEDIRRLPLFNPNKEELRSEIHLAGSLQEYSGQVYMFSNLGGASYPLPVYTSAMKDMNSEDAISVLDNRNINNRFMPGGIMLLPTGANYLNADFPIEEEQQRLIEQQEQEAITQNIQGAQNSGKIITLTFTDKEDKPEYVPFSSPNFSNDYLATSEKIKTSIRQAFRLPPILCSEKVSTGFDTDAMKSAFIYYNSITTLERENLRTMFNRIFSLWYDKHFAVKDFMIERKKWL